MSVNVVEKVDDRVPVRHALISVSDKRGLDQLVKDLLRVVPTVKIFSTGGTYARIKEILGDRAEGTLVQVSDYTGQPETQGGLVKTLDFKIYLGLLTETYNPSHAEDLKRTDAVPIDLVVVNLYPFQKTIEREGVTVEEARSNIGLDAAWAIVMERFGSALTNILPFALSNSSSPTSSRRLARFSSSDFAFAAASLAALPAMKVSRDPRTP